MSEEKSFNNRVTRGLFWTSLSFGAWKLISMVSIFVLARLLSPRDFGLVGIAVIVIGAIRMFQDMGIGCALIYSKDNSPELTSTAFYMILFSGLVFSLAGYFSADYAAAYFNNPGAIPVLKVLSANILIASIGTVPGFLLTKELQFKKRIWPEMAAALAQAVVSVFLALAGFGVWSLVAGDITNRAVAAIGAWIVHPWRPKLIFDFKLARELFSYSKFMVASSISSFATSNVDNIVVARMLGSTPLGYYSIAFRTASLPSTLTFFILSKVTFPVFSKLQDDRKRLASAFLRTVKYLTFASAPAGIVVYMLAPEIVGILLGSKWVATIAPLKGLIIYGLFTSIIWQAIEVYKATGRTDLSFRSETIRLFILIPLAVTGAFLGGIYGVAIAQSTTVALASMFYFVPLMRMLKIDASDLFNALYPAVLPSACILLSLWLVGGAFQQHPVLQASSILKLIVSFTVAGTIFFIFLMTFARARVVNAMQQFLPGLASATAVPPVGSRTDFETSVKPLVAEIVPGISIKAVKPIGSENSMENSAEKRIENRVEKHHDVGVRIDRCDACCDDLSEYREEVR